MSLLEVEQQVMNYLKKRMFKEAILAVANYESEQVPPRGLGIDWKHYNPNSQIKILTLIFNNKPEILTKMDDIALEYLRIAAAMMELWGVNTVTKWLPANFVTGLSIDNDTAARILLFKSQNEEKKKQYQSSGVRYVEVYPALDQYTCESCKQLYGKRYRIVEAPKLPIQNCTSKRGCRCCYLPCID
jgi:hypothetical protein